MTVSVVQSQIITQAGASWSGNFTNPVSAGNSIVLLADAAASSGSISSSAPLYNGASVTGAVQLWTQLEGASSVAYSTGWLLPDVSGSSAAVALTVTGGANFGSGATGLWALEVAGLGASPTVVSPAAFAGGTGTAVSSGATGSAAGAAIGVGCLVSFAQVVTVTGGGGWTVLTQMTSKFGAAAWQLLSAGAVTFAATSASSANWAAGAAIIQATAGGTVTVNLTAPDVALAAPLVAPRFPGAVSLTAPGMALAAPLLSPAGSGAATVQLTAPGMALAAPVLAPAGGGAASALPLNLDVMGVFTESSAPQGAPLGTRYIRQG